jgi:hypothetical protein
MKSRLQQIVSFVRAALGFCPHFSVPVMSRRGGLMGWRCPDCCKWFPMQNSRSELGRRFAQRGRAL